MFNGHIWDSEQNSFLGKDCAFEEPSYRLYAKHRHVTNLHLTVDTFAVELADRPAKPLVAVTPFCRQPAIAAPPTDTRFVNPSPPHHPVVASSAPVFEMHGTAQAADTQHPQPQDIRTGRECQEESSLADMDLVYVNEDDVRNSCYVNSSVLDPVQSYLVGRLASGELEGEYKVSDVHFRFTVSSFQR